MNNFMAIRYSSNTYKIVTVGLLTGLSAMHSFAKKPATQPNILFVALDDLRPELGCYGKH